MNNAENNKHNNNNNKNNNNNNNMVGIITCSNGISHDSAASLCLESCNERLGAWLVQRKVEELETIAVKIGCLFASPIRLVLLLALSRASRADPIVSPKYWHLLIGCTAPPVWPVSISVEPSAPSAVLPEMDIDEYEVEGLLRDDSDEIDLDEEEGEVLIDEMLAMLDTEDHSPLTGGIPNGTTDPTYLPSLGVLRAPKLLESPLSDRSATPTRPSCLSSALSIKPSFRLSPRCIRHRLQSTLFPTGQSTLSHKVDSNGETFRGYNCAFNVPGLNPAKSVARVKPHRANLVPRARKRVQEHGQASSQEVSPLPALPFAADDPFFVRVETVDEEKLYNEFEKKDSIFSTSAEQVSSARETGDDRNCEAETDGLDFDARGARSPVSVSDPGHNAIQSILDQQDSLVPTADASSTQVKRKREHDGSEADGAGLSEERPLKRRKMNATTSTTPQLNMNMVQGPTDSGSTCPQPTPVRYRLLETEFASGLAMRMSRRYRETRGSAAMGHGLMSPWAQKVVNRNAIAFLEDYCRGLSPVQTVIRNHNVYN